MQQLNFPKCEFRLKSSENKHLIFDRNRKKYVVLTPEEWVRQHVLHYLTEVKKYPASLISLEKILKINGLTRRYDLIARSPSGKVLLMVECKAPEIKINQEVFDQIARYNLSLNADLLMVTNGLEHFYCKMDYSNSRYEFLPDLPDYPNLTPIPAL
jgi:hypothetical protein